MGLSEAGAYGKSEIQHMYASISMLERCSATALQHPGSAAPKGRIQPSARVHATPQSPKAEPAFSDSLLLFKLC